MKIQVPRFALREPVVPPAVISSWYGWNLPRSGRDPEDHRAAGDRGQGSAIADEAIRHIAQLYAIEKEARGSPPDRRVEIRQAKGAPIFDDLEIWLHARLPTISGKSPLAMAIRYALTRMKRLRPYLDHGFLELDNNTAERAMRSVAVGRKNYLFVGSQTGGRAAAIAYTLIEPAKLNSVDPQAWLADTIARIPDYKITRVDDLLPWHWSNLAA